MKFPKRTKYMLFGSFIFLAFSLRYPYTPHEIGWDSYFIHGLVNTLNHHGNFSWWVHPLSPFGLTPFSYGSAVPVTLSAFSQLSGLSIESSIWLFGIICGILGIFGSYMAAKELFNNDNYIFLTVFGFTTSQVFLGYTTWTLTTRGFFITVLPFFIFLLLKNAKAKKFNIYTFVIILIFIFLVAIHHFYSFLVLPIISYLIIKRVYLSKKFAKLKKQKQLKKIINIICVIFLFLIILLILFDILNSTTLTGNVGEIYDSKFDWFFNIIIIYARQLGILGLFGIFGFFYLLFKPKISLNETLLIFFVLCLLLFIVITIYMPPFIAIFCYLLAGFGLYFIGTYFYKKKNKKFAIIILILILSISLTFSYFYRARYPDIDAETEHDEIYMEEDNYDAGLWLKLSTDDSIIYSNNVYPLKRIAGVMYLKQFPGSPIEQLENKYVSMEDFEVNLISPLDPDFWSESYYEAEPNIESINWKANRLKKENYDSNFSIDLILKYNIKYVIEDHPVFLDEKDKDKIFFTSLSDKCFKIYSNQDYSVWYIH